MIPWGTEVVDSITGYRGIVTARAEYMNGCLKCLVEAKRGKDGKEIVEWFDEQRLTSKSLAKAGGPMPLPPR